jgi:hypothetical protein
MTDLYMVGAVRLSSAGDEPVEEVIEHVTIMLNYLKVSYMVDWQNEHECRLAVKDEPREILLISNFLEELLETDWTECGGYLFHPVVYFLRSIKCPIETEQFKQGGKIRYKITMQC